MAKAEGVSTAVSAHATDDPVAAHRAPSIGQIRGAAMSWIDFLGFSASLAVLASFSMNTIVPLRVLALASNVLFMSYGFFGRLYPVLLLHLILLPINLFKLLQVRHALESVRSAPELHRPDHSNDARSSNRALSCPARAMTID